MGHSGSFCKLSNKAVIYDFISAINVFSVFMLRPQKIIALTKTVASYKIPFAFNLDNLIK
jgi:hypothetical protein